MGSENLELEKLIYNFTSSPIISGDVVFIVQKIPKLLEFRDFFWCRWPESNRHEVALGRF